MSHHSLKFICYLSLLYPIYQYHILMNSFFVYHLLCLYHANLLRMLEMHKQYLKKQNIPSILII